MAQLTLADLDRETRERIRKEYRARPHWRMLLGCERCARTCTEARKCFCCRIYKTRTAGGSLNFYPEDGKGHYPICEVAKV